MEPFQRAAKAARLFSKTSAPNSATLYLYMSQVSLSDKFSQKLQPRCRSADRGGIETRINRAIMYELKLHGGKCTLQEKGNYRVKFYDPRKSRLGSIYILKQRIFYYTKTHESFMSAEYIKVQSEGVSLGL